MRSSTDYFPERGVFETTLACNLRCKHCGSKAGVARPDELSTDECKALFDQLAALGMRWLTISGGEPTCRDDWPELIEAATRAGIRTGMITNAVSFGEDDAKLALEKGLCGLGLSLDGVGRVHDLVRGRIGHFNKLMDVMDSCVEAGLPFAVVTHVNHHNIGQLEDVHDLVLRKGAYAWQVQPGTDMGNMSDHPELLLTQRDLIKLEETLGSMIKKSPLRIHPSDSVGYFGPNEKLLRKSTGANCFGGCPAGKRVIGIESNGNIKGCLSIMAGYNENSDSFVEGNIRQESLADIWFKPGAFAYNRDWSIDDMGGFCRECSYVDRCKGGCTAKKVTSGGGVENNMCVYRARVEGGMEARRSSQAAAVILASLLGAAAQGCHHADSVGDNGDMDSGLDAGEDTDTDTDTEPVLAYGIPDTDSTGGDDYGMPDTDSIGDMEYGIPDTDTGGGADMYGIPCATPDE